MSDASSPWHMAVLIPARSEEALLPRCLHSVLHAASCLPAEVTCDVVVVSDRSQDRTVSIAQSMLREHGTVVQTMAGNVGTARSMAAATALDRLRMGRVSDPSRCWLANTDADCEVPREWLANQFELARRGFHAVAGIVDVDCFRDHLPVVESRFRQTYHIHADGSHTHVHGANLGVRADAYVRAGGWSPLETAEDHDLWCRLRETGARHVSDSSLRVVTSGRRVGRAPLGFADALARHNEFAAEPVLGAA